MAPDRGPQPSPIRVLSVGANPLQSSLVAAALAGRREVKMIGCAAELNQALQRAGDASVVLLHPAELAGGGLTWVRAISEKQQEGGLVVVGVPAREDLVVSYVEAGARGFVTEDQDSEQLVEAVHAVHRSEGYLAPDLAGGLLDRLSTLRQTVIDPEAAASRLRALTPRELEVLGLIAHGSSNREIAETLRIAVSTVKNHVHNILEKLQATDRWEAAACIELAARDGARNGAWPQARDPSRYNPVGRGSKQGEREKYQPRQTDRRNDRDWLGVDRLPGNP